MAGAPFRSRYGPWAVVAGASEGLGAEFARQLADRGLNVVLVADPERPPDDVAREVRRRCGVEARPLTADLASAASVPRIHDAVGDLDVGLLVYVAAFSPVRPFAALSEDELSRTIDVNVRAPVLLTRRLVPRLAERQRGGIIWLSSMAGLHGTPRVATYAATKAFNLVLGESLWYELRPLGIDALAWCPGATETPGYRRSGARPPGLFEPRVMPPDRVVAGALDALGKRPSGIAGLGNRLAAAVTTRLLPRRFAVSVMGRAMEQRYERSTS